MAPPVTETGIIGWVMKNLLSSWLSVILTVFGLYIIYLIVPVVVEFAIVNAIWVGKDGLEQQFPVSLVSFFVRR